MVRKITTFSFCTFGFSESAPENCPSDTTPILSRAQDYHFKGLKHVVTEPALDAESCRKQEPSPRIQIEEQMASKYSTVRNIGTIFGVYLGFSMITLAEILAYSLNICWFKLKR